MNAIAKLNALADKLDDPNRRLSAGELISARKLREIAKQMNEEQSMLVEDLDIAGLKKCGDCERYYFTSELSSEFPGGELLCPQCLCDAIKERADIETTQQFLDVTER